MEISDLTAQFMQNHDRIVQETIRKGRSGVKIWVIFDESWEILDQAVSDLTPTQSCDDSFYYSYREPKPLQVA
jgi:hypothetical protein